MREEKGRGNPGSKYQRKSVKKTNKKNLWFNFSINHREKDRMHDFSLKPQVLSLRDGLLDY